LRIRRTYDDPSHDADEEEDGRRDTEPTVEGGGFVELGPEEVDDEPMVTWKPTPMRDAPGRSVFQDADRWGRWSEKRSQSPPIGTAMSARAGISTSRVEWRSHQVSETTATKAHVPAEKSSAPANSLVRGRVIPDERADQLERSGAGVALPEEWRYPPTRIHHQFVSAARAASPIPLTKHGRQSATGHRLLDGLCVAEVESAPDDQRKGEQPKERR
jgi:hypothetical protein